MATTSIEWTNKVWNPVTGCTKVSAGCKNCYAERIFNRFRKKGPNPLGLGAHFAYREFTDVQCHPERLDQPLHWKKPSMVFVNSMSDLFHEKIPKEFLMEVFATMALCPQHTFQILTKRPERMVELLNDWSFEACCEGTLQRKLSEKHGRVDWIDEVSFHFKSQKNIWLGVSVENQKTADERIPILLETPAAVRWLSIEPMLENIKLGGFDGTTYRPWLDTAAWDCHIDWIVVGCESGPKKRECKIEWIENIVDQCKSANVPVFVKQIQINKKVIKDINQFPEHLRIREYPKSKSKGELS